MILDDHIYQRKVIDTKHLTQQHDLPSYVFRDINHHLDFESEPGKVRAWLNGSSIVYNGKRYLIYRTECKRWNHWSRLSMCELNKSFNPIDGTNKLLNINTRFVDGVTFWGAEDPKFFTFNNKLFASCGDGYNVIIIAFDKNARVINSFYIPKNIVLDEHPSQSNRQKNWGFFVSQNRLFAHIHPDGHKFFEFDKDFNVINKFESEFSFKWPHTCKTCDMGFHGASPPKFHNNLFWRFIHSYTEHYPTINEHKARVADYFATIIAFKCEPPFEMVYACKEPLVTSVNDFGPNIPTWNSTVFIGSQERVKDGWRIFYGENDLRIVTRIIPDDIINKNLISSDKFKFTSHSGFKAIEKPTPKVLKVTHQQADVAYYTYPMECGISETARTNSLAIQLSGKSVDRRSINGLASGMNGANSFIHHWHPIPNFDERLFGRGSIAYWVWECENGLHDNFKKASDHVDEIWTASTWCKEIFERGTRKKVRVIPHGVFIRDDFKPQPLPHNTTGIFKFLFIFDGRFVISRKNPEGLIKSFLNAFQLNDKSVRLVLKSVGLTRELIEYLTSISHNDPRISIINERYTPSDMDLLMRSADCFVSLHKSEGFGMNIAKAMASGVPVICSGYSGNLDFCEQDNSYLIPCKEVPANNKLYAGGIWGDPNIDDAIYAMRLVKNQANSIDQIRQKAFDVVKERLSFNKLCATFQDIL